MDLQIQAKIVQVLLTLTKTKLAYPTDLIDLDTTRGTASQTLSTPSHVDHHVAEDAVIEALQAKVGIDSSAVTSSLDYKVSNAASVNPGHKHSLLAGISDVAITTPTTGNGLFYNEVTSKWENASTSVADASATVKGVSKLSAAPAASDNPIAVGTNDGRVPTQDENDALAGTGTPSTSNKYVTEDTLNARLPVGTVAMHISAAAPTGWLLCDGTAVSRATYAALFAIISTTYGAGDTTTTFNTPDFRGRSPIGVGTGAGGGASGTGLPTGGSALTAVARAGWKGEETHVLTEAEMPAHVHSGGMSTTGANATNGADKIGTANTGSAGSGTAHNIQTPCLGINFIIKT